jgi:hypothetical protein
MLGYTLMIATLYPNCFALLPFVCFDFASFACYVLRFIRMLCSLLYPHVTFHCLFTHAVHREDDPVMRSLTSREEAFRSWHLLVIRTLHYKLSGAMPRRQPI